MATFYLDYGVQGADRKRLVKAISEFTGADSRYLGAPTFAYSVDYFTIDKSGVVSFDDRADSEEIEGLIEALAEQGFVSLVSDLGAESDEDAQESESGEGADNSPAEDETAQSAPGLGLTIEMPLDKVDVDNLRKLVAAKNTLIKNALGASELPIEIKDEKVVFPWFDAPRESDTAKAYIRFIEKLCEFSKAHKITAKEKPAENEKYAFRCFLLRLGFIGDEYKYDRKVLLEWLPGNAAFKSGTPTETVKTICYGKEEIWSSRRKAEKYFLEAMNGSEGSEHERYSRIYEQLKAGQSVCTDNN